MSGLPTRASLAVSLRAIARDMGMVPSALYRYFPSHGHLLEALADDAATSMIDAVRHGISVPPVGDYEARWQGGLRAYRQWVLSHIPGYSLNFCDPSERSSDARPDVVVRQLVETLSTVIADACQAGQLDPAYFEVGQSLSTASGHRPVSDPASYPLLQSATLNAWSAVHGLVALEATKRLPEVGVTPDDLFESQLMAVTRAMGFGNPRPGSRSIDVARLAAVPLVES